MRSFNPLRILSTSLLSVAVMLCASSAQAGPCTADPKLSPDGVFSTARAIYKGAKKAESEAKVEIKNFKALIEALNSKIHYARQSAKNGVDGIQIETINLDRLKKDLQLVRTLKDRIDPRLDHLIATLKGLIMHQLHVEDAWLRTTMRTTLNGSNDSYGDMKVFLDGQFAGKKIRLAMDWDFKNSESNFIRLGEALLAGSYSFQGASDVDLKFLTPEPLMQFSCTVSNQMLSVKGQKAQEGQPVVFWPSQAGTDAQNWFFKDSTLTSKLSTHGATYGGQQWKDKNHLVISVDPKAQKDNDGHIKSGAGLVLQPRSGDPLQRWKMVKHSNGVRVENYGTSFALDCGAKTDAGAQVKVTDVDPKTKESVWKVDEIHMKKEEKASQD